MGAGSAITDEPTGLEEASKFSGSELPEKFGENAVAPFPALDKAEVQNARSGKAPATSPALGKAPTYGAQPPEESQPGARHELDIRTV